MDDIRFAVEQLHPNLIPQWLLLDHYDENAPIKRVFKQDLDWSRYMQAQDKDEFFLVTARIGLPQLKVESAGLVGKLVGYMAMFLQPHLHYRQTKVACDDAHYLMPEYRGQGAGKAMIAFAEKVAAERGASVFSMRCKAEQSHAHIFESLGYKLTDLVFLKELSHEE
jgi:GNAT superfamily N-acetyltransferase